jgi:hypothetical protein
MNIVKDIVYSSKNDILDPLSTIIKLFIYSYKPTGTKISIYNNKLIIQERGMFQGAVRKLYRDTKNDINIIFYPVIFACKYFLSIVENKKKFIKIFEVICTSFNKLKETYQGNEIIYNIDQLKNIVESFLKNDEFDPVSIISNYDTPSNKIKQGIYSHLSTVWNESRLNILFGYIDEIMITTSEELMENLILSLSSYANCIDILTSNLINNL